jgi:hypothetical protein
MRTWILGFGLFVLTGCTNYLYQGAMIAPDSDGVERQVIAHWSKTDPWVGDAKASPVALDTGCGETILFVERNEGIVFRGEPGRDVDVNTDQPIAEGDLCGRVVGKRKLLDLDGSILELTVHCKPTSGEFSTDKRTYVQARREPYKFDISMTKEWNWLGGLPSAPIAECAE